MSNLVVADQQIVAGVTSTLEWWNLDENGEGAAADGTVTVGITRADGTELIAAGAATIEDTDPDNVGRYTYTLDATDSTTLDVLTVTWAVGGTATGSTIVEIVGGFLFTVKEARESYDGLENTTDVPTSDIVKYRQITDAELTWICDRAFTPRFRRLTLDGTGTGTLTLPDNDLRTVTAVSVGGTAYTDDEIADLKVYEHRRVDQVWNNIWDFDQENVVIAYTFGLDRPMPDLKEAALTRFREMLWGKNRELQDNAAEVVAGGMTMRVDKPDEFATGNRLVDSVYRRYSLRIAQGSGDAGKPAAYGRTVSYPPAAGSLFRGLRW